MNKQKLDSKLIFKFSFTNPLFLEHELILNWNYSKAVLLTSFDLLKDEQLILELQRRGITLKEYLHERGFNKDVKLICDTGIFEYEVKKAKLQLAVPEYEIFSQEDIFNAYRLINPDYLVAPDEIILQSDTRDQIKVKMGKMMLNVQKTLESFPKEKVIPVLHGFTKEDMNYYLDFLESEQLKIIARGGLIPLWNESKIKFKQVIKESEYLVRQKFDYIHSFGLPSLRTIKDYFYENSYDSLDTSILYYRTAQRRYLIDKGYFISVRNAYFSRCGCEGCQLMKSNTYKPNSGDFAIGLYVHNCNMLTKLVDNLNSNPNIFEMKKFNRMRSHKAVATINTVTNTNTLMSESSFVSAASLLPKNQCTKIYLEKKVSKKKKLPLKILIISSCSKNKSISAEYVYSLSDLRTAEQREKILAQAENKIQAKKLYDSERIALLNSVTGDLREICDTVELYFLSAGFGLVHEDTKLPPYDVTFSNKSQDEIQSLSHDLKLQESIENLPDNYDIVFLDLFPDYITALQPIETLASKTKELIVFTSETTFTNNIIQLNSSELLFMDQISNYLPFKINNNTRVSLLKNFFLYLVNTKILGNFQSFSSWIQDVLHQMKEKKYVLRV